MIKLVHLSLIFTLLASLSTCKTVMKRSHLYDLSKRHTKSVSVDDILIEVTKLESIGPMRTYLYSGREGRIIRNENANYDFALTVKNTGSSHRRGKIELEISTVKGKKIKLERSFSAYGNEVKQWYIYKGKYSSELSSWSIVKAEVDDTEWSIEFLKDLDRVTGMPGLVDTGFSLNSGKTIIMFARLRIESLVTPLKYYYKEPRAFFEFDRSGKLISNFLYQTLHKGRILKVIDLANSGNQAALTEDGGLVIYSKDMNVLQEFGKVYAGYRAKDFSYQHETKTFAVLSSHGKTYENIIELWQEEKKVRTLTPKVKNACCITYLPSGNFVISADNGNLTEYDSDGNKLKVKKTKVNINQLALAPDKSYLVSAGGLQIPTVSKRQKHNHVCIWKPNLKLVKCRGIKRLPQYISSISFSNDSKLFAISAPSSAAPSSAPGQYGLNVAVYDYSGNKVREVHDKKRYNAYFTVFDNNNGKQTLVVGSTVGFYRISLPKGNIGNQSKSFIDLFKSRFDSRTN